MVRVPIVQEINSQKKRNPSCTVSTTIIDFETGEMICQNCGVVYKIMSHLMDETIIRFQRVRILLRLAIDQLLDFMIWD